MSRRWVTKRGAAIERKSGGKTAMPPYRRSKRRNLDAPGLLIFLFRDLARRVDQDLDRLLVRSHQLHFVVDDLVLLGDLFDLLVGRLGILVLERLGDGLGQLL